ncbi:MAG: NDP-sugar synthase, partial [Alphaproteobacteria bacterium]
DVFVNADYRADQIVGHLELARAGRMQVRYLREDRLGGALGSAGTLLHLQDINAAFDGDFIVMCGDTIADIDLAALVDCHRRSGAAATIATRRVAPDQVHKYGIAVTGPEGEIVGFQEKPRPAEAASDLASTGIYVFNPRALALLPRKGAMDIAGDLLPRLLAAGERVQSYEADFAWMDIGAPIDLYNASVRALGQRIAGAEPAGIRGRGGVWLGDGARLSRLSAVKGPAFIGADARVAAGASLRGPVIIGTDARIGAGAQLRHCLVLPGTTVPRGQRIESEIVGPGFRIPLRSKPEVERADRLAAGAPRAVVAGAAQGV